MISCESLALAVDIYRAGLGMYLERFEVIYFAGNCVGLS